ncbi:MAG TPA: hypothetical protein VK963_02005, partial [Candidatus Saccharimonadales bacterium]|nr:hypothetical protein [Candidatus Saccharimonadales bacterium]
YRAATRLRSAGLSAQGVAVYLRFTDRSGWQQLYHRGQPFCDSATFFSHVSRLLASCPLAKPVRLVSISAIDLTETKSLTMNLFDSGARQARLSQAMDEVNFRYGEGTMVTASQLLAAKPRDAIGFANVRNPEPSRRAKDHPHELPH